MSTEDKTQFQRYTFENHNRKGSSAYAKIRKQRSVLAMPRPKASRKLNHWLRMHVMYRSTSDSGGTSARRLHLDKASVSAALHDPFFNSYP